jgi:hypothetical protein
MDPTAIKPDRDATGRQLGRRVTIVAIRKLPVAITNVSTGLKKFKHFECLSILRSHQAHRSVQGMKLAK